ncbi:DUF4157 domain-containing protein [Pseudoalteromonas piscicida]|uniref:DUF4157 domain-containing protein n=1 Tax=Pseudoalteromonas piscicida TaxID=43662 RepID=A0AAQ2IR90_PSEO7|nr:hypothetical protein TW75_04465 [Pseudoalteromonas piscicida]TMN82197.1 DUF4157 domain-containing protein [Pseudoalteromonas flavipulchra]TMN40233.1 DUF4157 domain-containing protein [Pseudoalteromonas piscicida]TMN42498.1 DUF4157 domain-containing protein [Pseudoalteromonas piscicida]TMN53583.1 DUF4157 domain-containing protein [Pseudoalteromonas piscicida]
MKLLNKSHKYPAQSGIFHAYLLSICSNLTNKYQRLQTFYQSLPLYHAYSKSIQQTRNNTMTFYQLTTRQRHITGTVRQNPARQRRAKNVPLKSCALPIRLRRGMEKLSGVNLANVRVHYNSSKPSQVQAHAYAQGKDIYLAPGQEKHLPHELGHVVQQALGIVKPTTEVNGIAVNDDPTLEQQATDWGKLALYLGEQMKKCRDDFPVNIKVSSLSLPI